MRYVDRSRVIQWQRCPRSRYWGYEWNNTGLSKVAQSIPLATGQHVHIGCAEIMQGHDTDVAVDTALAEYTQEVALRGLDIQQSEDLKYVFDEQSALIEALIRLFASRSWPEIQAEYTVIEVEREDTVPLTNEIMWMSRADALLIDKANELYVWSLKTKSTWDKRADEDARVDIQGLSEAWAIEQRLQEQQSALKMEGDLHEPISAAVHDLLILPEQSRVAGVKMEFLLKGPRKEYPEGSGRWVQWSPLIRGYRHREVVGDDSYAWAYQYRDDQGIIRRLGKGWERFDVWAEPDGYPGGVAQWVKDLDAGKIQPEAGDCLAAQRVTPVPYYRQDRELEDWVEQARAQESRIAEIAWAAEDGTLSMDNRGLLNHFYPQHRHSCSYPGKCQFWDLCYTAGVADDPIGSGLYKIRTPHHQVELEQHKVSSNG